MVVAASLLAVLVVAEGGVRVVERRLPRPLVWHSWEAQRKAEQMAAFSRRVPRADVVMLGTSMVNNGIDPEVFKQLTGARGLVYNAGLGAAVPAVTRRWEHDVVLPRLHPRRVVIGVSSIDVASGVGATSVLDLYRKASAARLAAGTASPIERVDNALAQHSRIWRYRTVLRSPVDLVHALRGKHTPNEGDAIGRFGRSTIRSRDRYERQRRSRRNAERRNLAGFTIGAQNLRDLTAEIADLRRSGVDVALVEMPVTAEYESFHPNGSADYLRFVAAVDALARRTHTRFLPMRGEITDHALFADDNHLNGAGTRVFTELLARRLVAAGFVPGR